MLHKHQQLHIKDDDSDHVFEVCPEVQGDVDHLDLDAFFAISLL